MLGGGRGAHPALKESLPSVLETQYIPLFVSFSKISLPDTEKISIRCKAPSFLGDGQIMNTFKNT